MTRFNIKCAASTAAVVMLGACASGQQQPAPEKLVTVVAPSYVNDVVPPAPVIMQMTPTDMGALKNTIAQATEKNGGSKITSIAGGHMRSVGIGFGFWDAMGRAEYELLNSRYQRVEFQFGSTELGNAASISCDEQARREVAFRRFLCKRIDIKFWAPVAK